MNETIQFINNRVSIRKFNNKPIDEKIMDNIIHAAMRAPTAGNMMLYSIIKIQDKDMLKKLSETCDHQPFIGNSDTALLFAVDLYKWHKYFLLNKVPEYAKRTNRVYEGPTLGDCILGINDALIAAQSAVIAAESYGVGSCYIGDIMENIEVHRQLLNLPKYVFPATLIVFGNYDHQPKLRSRFAKEFVVFDEKYKSLSDDEIKEMFKEQEAKFNSNPVSDFENFAQQFYNRKIGSDFFKEMNRSLKEIMKDFK
ncbi:nitroreductase family protein [Anaeromicrobium sediminis]|uniref:Nitroreductase domain-containing protein n=1 Tax=Anaeromicrobium sediminis TaxID=1478221 RepID=A0A267ML78_9FIRM|nr:nitroreductase family protein [Anaeromicrobium sediminis]PAB60177.1 hypothetical protein CCE28_07350 [Anaeromicrobium sediminis]